MENAERESGEGTHQIEVHVAQMRPSAFPKWRTETRARMKIVVACVCAGQWWWCSNVRVAA
eukprot:3204403-Pleurochrysis_carterae.AAC.1